MKKIAEINPSRIVLFHMSTLGDLLFSLPAIHAIRWKYPEAKITSVLAPAFAELLSTTGLIDDTVHRSHAGWQAHARIFGELRPRHYDLAVCFSQSRASTIHAVASGAAHRIGFSEAAFAMLLTMTIPRHGPPSVSNNLRLVQAIACEPTRSDYVGLIQPQEEHQSHADRLLTDINIGDMPFVVIANGASARQSIKEWTPEGFSEVVRWLSDEKGLTCVSVGTERPVKLLALAGDRLRDLCGQTSLTVLSAILKRATLFVGIDSGVMHLASAMGTPVVGIFGPSDPRHTGPLGERCMVVRREIPCSPCMKTWCQIRTHECLRDLHAEEVIRAADTVLARQIDELPIPKA